MNLETSIGFSACIITTLYTSVGLASQLWINHLRKSTKQLSFIMLILMFLTFSSWVVYGLYHHDLYILVPNLIGTVLSFGLNIQKFMSRAR